MYTGGLRHKFTNVLLNEISLFDIFDWFYDVTGEKPDIVDAYYIMPMEEAENGLRKLKDDTLIREMIMTMKDHDTINIWLEKSHHPVTSITPNRVESSSGVNINDRDPLLNHGDQVFIDVDETLKKKSTFRMIIPLLVLTFIKKIKKLKPTN
ncbi:hypothetical protein OROHE_015583 [Orobanche hederae]